MKAEADSLSAGWRYDFRWLIIALVLYSVMSLNLATSTDNYETNKYQRLRDSVDWTYLRNWVLQGPWDIDERLSALFYVLRSYVKNPILSE